DIRGAGAHRHGAALPVRRRRLRAACGPLHTGAGGAGPRLATPPHGSAHVKPCKAGQACGKAGVAPAPWRYARAMSRARILLTDDDVELAQLLRDFLEREGFEVILAHDADAALAAARDGAFDALVLDVMMPGRSGLDALRELRRESA